MRHARSLGVAQSLLFAGLMGCTNMKHYALPLTPSEGLRMVPALISAAQESSLEAWRTQSGAVAKLEDGTLLSWQRSANDRDFILVVQLPSETTENAREGAFVQARKRADDIWQKALALRGAMLPPPVSPSY